MLKATFLTKPLSEAVSAVNPVVPGRSPKATLQNLLLTINEESATIAGTNLEQYVSIDVACEAAGSGRLLVKADKFAAILKTCQSETVSIEETETGIVIRSGKSRWTMPTANPDEFPIFPASVDGETVSISADAFRLMLKRVSLAAESQSTQAKFATTSIQVETRDNGICLSATDGKRAAYVIVPCEVAKQLKGLIPLSAVRHIERAISTGENVQIRVGQNNAEFFGGGARVWTLLSHGQLPDIPNHLPRINDERKIYIASSSLAKSVQQVALAGSETSLGVDLTFEAGNLVLEASSSEHGQASAEMPIPYDLEPASLRIDPTFLLELLRAIGDVTITVMANKDSGETHRGAVRYEQMLLDVGEFHYFIAGMVTPRAEKVVNPRETEQLAEASA